MITLKTLPQATAQEVFDQIAVHMLTQKKRSTTIGRDEEYCVYKNDEGLRCAGGCLISDEEYKDDFERKDWETLIKANMVPESHCLLISELQMIHDSFEIEYWKKNLIYVAKVKKLNTTAIEKF